MKTIQVIVMAAIAGLLAGLVLPVNAVTTYSVPENEAAMVAPAATHCSIVTYKDTESCTTDGARCVVTNLALTAGTNSVRVVKIVIDRPFRDASVAGTTNCTLSVGTLDSVAGLAPAMQVCGTGNSPAVPAYSNFLNNASPYYTATNIITVFTNTVGMALGSNDVGQARIYFEIRKLNE